MAYIQEKKKGMKERKKSNIEGDKTQELILAGGKITIDELLTSLIKKWGKLSKNSSPKRSSGPEIFYTRL